MALLALALAALLIYASGWQLARALSAGPEPADWLERAFGRALAGALLNGWLALTLAELGVFSIWLHLGLIAALCAALWRWRGRAAAPGPAAITWDAVALAVILGAFALGIAARPFEVILGVRDAGVYATTGLAIARTGGVVQHDDLVAEMAADQRSDDPALRAAAEQAETNFLGVQARQRTIATRLRQAGFFIDEGDLDAGRVVPQGFHLYPAWVGLLAGLAGPKGGLAATGLLGLLGLWGAAMVGRRLAGPWVGVGGALLLALNGPQAWFSRYSTAEAIAQFLTFAGLACFAAMQAGGEEPPAARRGLGRRELAALMAGLCFGQLALARIDFGLVVGPALAYLFVCWLRRRWGRGQSWLAAGMLAMLAQAAVHIVTIARAYFFDTLFARLQDYALTALVAYPFLTPALQQIYLLRPCSRIAIQPCPPVADMPPATFTGWNYRRILAEVAVVLVAALAVLALRRWGQPLMERAERLARRRAAPLLALSAVGIGLAGGYAYLVRPQILSRATLAALPGCLSPAALRAPAGACLALQGYIGAPVAPPAYADPVWAAVTSLPRALRGQKVYSPAECAAFRAGILPPDADGRTSVELRRDGLASEQALGAEAWRKLQACDATVLRDLFANSQPNLVRVGWYLSPLGVLLAVVGLALWWRRMGRDSWLFLAVALVASVFFIRLTYGTSDQHYIYILRRYVPQVYPAFCLGAAYALAALARALPGQLGRARLRRGAAAALGLALVGFSAATNLKIYAHTEYAGALDQIGAIAERFGPRDVLLLRGGAPGYGSSRDIPDNLATPLTYAFGRGALTIKSAQPGAYAEQLAAYVRRWQSEGRSVYLLASASGAVGLPGLALERVGPAELALREFEQPTEQKPSNVQDYTLDFQVYRVVPAGAAPAALSLAPDDYAAQARGLYRAEQIAGERMAWTDGDALLRLPRPAAPVTVTLRLAPGPTRPASLGRPRVCLSFRSEPRQWPEDPAAPPFSPERCVTLAPGAGTYTLRIDPAGQPAGGTLLLRIASDTWVPARDDPAQHDRRRLGVLFGGLTVGP